MRRLILLAVILSASCEESPQPRHHVRTVADDLKAAADHRALRQEREATLGPRKDSE